MKKHLLYFCWMMITSCQVSAQADSQFSIRTDKGIFTVSKTAGGRDMIVLSFACWDEIVAGTKYNSGRLSKATDKNVFLQITDKKKGCSAGIGFGCSIFDCNNITSLSSQIINRRNRLCAVSVRIVQGSVRLIFNNRVQWDELAKD